MECTRLITLILFIGQTSTLDFSENVGHADRYREYGGLLDTIPSRPRRPNPRVFDARATTKVSANVPITSKMPKTTTKLFTTTTTVTRKPHTTTKTPFSTTLTPHIIMSRPTTRAFPLCFPRRPNPRVIIRATTKVAANVPMTTKIPNTTTEPFTTTTTVTRKPHTTTRKPITTTSTPHATKLTTQNTPKPLSLDISGLRLKYVRQTKDHKVFKHTFRENEELRLKCTFQTQRTAHVLKMMNEFGQGSQMNSDQDYINDDASVSYTFRINSKSKYIYCIAMDTAGRTLLTSVDMEFVGSTSDSDCRFVERLQLGKLVVIKDELPPLLWTIGLVIQVFPAEDNSSISVARVLTGRGGGVPIIKPFTDLLPFE